MQKELGRKSWGKSWRQIFKGVLPKWHGPFQARLTPSVIPSEVEESLILTITSSKRCLDCARHDKKPIWATRSLDANPQLPHPHGFKPIIRACADRRAK